MWSRASRVAVADLVPAYSDCRVLHVTAGRLVRAQRPKERPEAVEIPGLEPITFRDRMHFVPGLAEPKHPAWEREWVDPLHRRGPKYEEMPLYKERPCYTFHQRTKLLEGKRRAARGHHNVVKRAGIGCLSSCASFVIQWLSHND